MFLGSIQVRIVSERGLFTTVNNLRISLGNLIYDCGETALAGMFLLCDQFPRQPLTDSSFAIAASISRSSYTPAA
ncbi:MAG: hypothetical protein LBD08_03370 [Treponema sp.]|jgi:hypothetical protein|nr:hypothetical protein [Treponema sp.]